MPEEALAEAQDTPDAPEPDATPDGTPAETPQTDNYEQRYTELRSKFNERDEDIARLRQLESFVGHLQDPQTQAQALQALGLELEDVEALEDDEEPDLESRLDKFEEYLTAQAEQQAEAEVQDLLSEFSEQEFAKLEKEHGDLSKEAKELIEVLADRLSDEDGVPDYEGAYEHFSKVREADLKNYRESKKAPSVELGTAGTEKIDMSDDDARTQFLADMLEAGKD